MCWKRPAVILTDQFPPAWAVTGIAGATGRIGEAVSRAVGDRVDGQVSDVSHVRRALRAGALTPVRVTIPVGPDTGSSDGVVELYLPGESADVPTTNFCVAVHPTRSPENLGM